MLHLTLVGLSEDNRRLLLVSDAGEQFSLVIDAKLRAALRGEHARLGQLEIQMESALRPRDIQARIRAGETPESVAQAAQTTVDKILPYANPVLAERAHVASRAQRSSVRRTSGDSGGARTLGDAVAAMLRAHNVDPGSVEWDAWRREDGRWSLLGTYAAPKRRGTAKFTFDAPGNYVTLDNDDAKWLVGEVVPKGAPTPKDDLQRARQRRLKAVGEEELPLGDDALDLVNEGLATEATADLTESVSALRDAETAASEPELSPTPEPLADEPARHPARHPAQHPSLRSAARIGRDVAAVPADQPADQPAQEPAEEAVEEAAARRPARKKGRASVPSWDEIMFGGGKQD